MKRVVKIGGIAGLGLILIGFLLLVWLYWYFSKDLPPLYTLMDYHPKLITEVYSDDGRLIAEFAEEYRKIVPYQEIPPYLVKAFLAIEDARFYEHKGLDFYRLLGALWNDIKAGRFEQGASTITMQVARTFFLTQKKLISRKLKEMILAWRIDHYLTKEEILWLYMSQIYLGNVGGRNIYGVEAASEQYFGKSVRELSLAESTLLAAIPRSPAYYSPVYHFERAKARQKLVLERMVEVGWLSEEEAKQAEAEPIVIKVKRNPYTTDSAYFVEAVRRHLVKIYGAEMVLTRGLKVFTTMNLDMQKAGAEAVKKGLAGQEGLDKRQGYRGALAKVEQDKISEYLDNQEKELAEDWRFYNTINGGDPTASVPAPVPLEVGKKYQGVILEVDKSNRQIKLGIGKTVGVIKEEDYRWALGQSGKSLAQVFNVGDVILVSVLELKAVKQGYDYRFALEQEPEAEAGLIAFSVKTGEVKALIGGYDFQKSQLIRPLQSHRQPGSAFKAILYASALSHPTKSYTPATIIYDAPVVFEYEDSNEAQAGEEAKVWKPANYGGSFQGPRTLRVALEKSINTISVKIMEDLGVDWVLKFVRRLGIESPVQADLSLALGSSPVSLLELARAYNVFASGGYLVQPYMIRRVYDREGNLLEWHKQFTPRSELSDKDKPEIGEMELAEGETSQAGREKKEFKGVKPEEVGEPGADEYLVMLREGKIPSLSPVGTEPEGEEVLSPQLSFLMVNLLEGVVQRGTGWRAKTLGRPLAGKTGTTNDFRDAWFVGFSPELICGVWVGFDDFTRSLGENETGAQAALPIWIEFMKEALKPIPANNFRVPENIEFANIDQDTGLLASSCTEKSVLEAFLAGTAPMEFTACGPKPESADLIRSLDQ